MQERNYFRDQNLKLKAFLVTLEAHINQREVNLHMKSFLSDSLHIFKCFFQFYSKVRQSGFSIAASGPPLLSILNDETVWAPVNEGF